MIWGVPYPEVAPQFVPIVQERIVQVPVEVPVDRVQIVEVAVPGPVEYVTVTQERIVEVPVPGPTVYVPEVHELIVQVKKPLGEYPLGSLLSASWTIVLQKIRRAVKWLFQ